MFSRNFYLFICSKIMKEEFFPLNLTCTYTFLHIPNQVIDNRSEIHHRGEQILENSKWSPSSTTYFIVATLRFMAFTLLF